MRPHQSAVCPPLRGRAVIASSLVALAIGIAPQVRSQQIHLPSSPAGWTSETRDEKDVADYLAFHKARAAERLAFTGGRQTPNQELYDAVYYDLDLALDPDTDILSGVVRIDARVVTGPLSVLDLDLDNLMTVSSVTSGGAPTTFSHVTDILSVDLDHAYATDEIATLVVTYSGNPQGGGAWGWDTHLGAPMIWTLSEPYGARTWWPCKDWPLDKADSLDIAITAPAGMITASNGTLISHTDNGTTATTVWEERYPIMTYLVSIASHPFTVYSDSYHYSPADSMEIQFYMFADDYDAAFENNAKTKDMLGTFADLFGEYPFLTEKYGHAEFPWGGGMEHQTCTSLGYFGESVIAHEAAHQWWGDMIGPKNFHHVWLNEGFATYAEALWWESLGGYDAYIQDMGFNKYFGPGTIIVENLDNWNDIFDSNLSYRKASWVLHMLRHILGDEDFFASLAAYRAAYEHSVADTEDFQAICESISGMDLAYYFQEWIYGEYYPEYFFTYETTGTAGDYTVEVTLDQTQNWQIFKMPIDVTIETESGEATFVVVDSLTSQTFTFNVAEAPTAVRIDKYDWVLKTVQEPVVQPPFDRAILLVNGVSWDTYGAEIVDAYEAKAFWGDYQIDFWDHFNEPAGGYPSTLPEPIGHGSVPAQVIGHYRNVIWIGNDYGGDLGSWTNTPILSYLEAGGNVLLMTRNGANFITDPFEEYLGITWVSGTVIYDCVAVYPGLTNIARTGTQSYTGLFDSNLTNPESLLLYQAQQNYNPDRGIGVWRRPPQGGTYRSNGAQMVFLSGRPYRWNFDDLRTNVMFILEHMFEETVEALAVDEPAGEPGVLRLHPARPNPLVGSTQLTFELPQRERVRIDVIDVTGRQVRGLIDSVLPGGTHTAVWDGRIEGGQTAPAGIYWVTLRSDSGKKTRQITLLR